MSVAVCEGVNARLCAAGVVVREAPGWRERGNGQTSDYEGGIVHHTATAFGTAVPGTGVYKLLVNGRSDLRGPLCNYAGNEDGSITVIAAHPANHAGASGGRSMGPLPTTRSFNRTVLGLEIVYPGTVPMRTAQYRSALVWANAVAAVCGRGDIQRIRAHAETSVTGKWDPGQADGVTINMAAFRAAARVVGQQQQEEEDDMPTAQEIAAAILNTPVPRQGSKLGGATSLRGLLAWYDAGMERDAARDAALAAAVTALSRNPGITPQQLAAEVDKAVDRHTPTATEIAAAIDVAQRPHILAAVRQALGEDNQDQADAIVDEIVSRLANPNL